MLGRLLAAFFLLMAHPLTGWAQDTGGALELLDQVGRHYAEAKSYHIESIVESRSQSELSSDWSKEYLSAEQATGKRYRFEGRTSTGSGIVVSDGVTEWNLYRSYGQYTKKAAGTYTPYTKTLIMLDNRPEFEASNMRTSLATMSDSIKSAHFLKDAAVSIEGHRVSCFVVTFGPEDLLKPFPSGRTTQTIWIDKARKTIVKTLVVSDSGIPYDPGHPPTHPISRHVETDTIYPVVSLDDPIPDRDFAFSPPEDALLVDSLPLPYGYGLVQATYASRSSVSTPQELPNMIGRMEPSVTYHGADGSSFKLESLRGHPVLIDHWATWCVPCLAELPLLNRIHNSTKNAGLFVVGLDLDNDAATAVDYLKRKGYDWPDYHVSGDKGYGLPNTGVPLHVLIDSEGKIVYYHDGANDEAGLVKAIKALSPAYAEALNGVE